jgi:iron complex transport system ATP-binding protein
MKAHDGTAAKADARQLGAVRFSKVCVDVFDARRSASRRLLTDIDWTVGRGEHWVVLGPNGAGKSTILHTTRGLIEPSQGAVSILGSRPGAPGYADPLQRIGVIDAVPPRFAGRMGAADVVLTRSAGSPALRGARITQEDVERAIALLSRFGCYHLRDRRYNDCSRGERQRIQLARSLMRDPSLLLFDEPTTGLDLPGRELFLQAMSRLAAIQPELTTVSVTHHVEEIPSSATHALLLDDGEVVAAGSIEETLTDSCLSECFGAAILISHSDGRFSARLRGSKQDRT